MGKESDNKRSRRNFITLNFNAFTEHSGSVQKQSTPRANNDLKTKMLTPDGKLVEVDKSALELATKRKRARNSDIWNWMDKKPGLK